MREKALDRPSGGAAGALPREEVISVSIAWDDIGGLVDAHERFLSGALVEADVRGSVLDSWKRCRIAGIEPGRMELFPRASGLACS